MNYKMMGRLIALILVIEAIFMLPALGISIYDGTAHVTRAFVITIAVMIAVAVILALLSRKPQRGFFAKEGLFCVGLSWIAMSLVGCLPFCLSGEIPHYIDALFEIVSGFTTTGSSILTNVEALPNGLLYWRSFSHWLGGMGVLVFLLALVPLGGKNEGFTMHLLRAESPGPSVDKLVPKMRQTAAVLYGTYFVLTVINILFLLAGDMPLLEALCTAFGTAGTGGLAIKNDSMASYSPYIQNVTTVFMLLFGINFGCYYLLLLRRFRDVFRDGELRLYLGVVFGSIVLITCNLFFNAVAGCASLWDALRHASFQVSSIITTTGYATIDFNFWPNFSKAILMILMMIGACAGSTGGGLKCIRVLVLLKSIRRNLAQMLNPRRVKVIRVNEKAVDEQMIANTNAYLGIYVLILIVSFLLVSFDNGPFQAVAAAGYEVEHTLTTHFSAVLSCFNNIGPGLEAVGPMLNFSGYSYFSKLVLIFDMLAGRLELFPILVLFSASTWKRR